jgi:kynurenine formamidase
MTDVFPRYADLPVDPSAPPGSTWGVFGRDDQLGTLNFLTPERRRQATHLVQRGDTINLDHRLDLPARPFFEFRTRPKHVLLSRRNGNTRDEYLDGFYPQFSSQWDGLRHMRNPAHGFYNWVRDEDVETTDGRLGMENFSRHGIVGRGVLLDVARYLAAHGDTLAPDERRELPTSLLDEVAKDQGVQLEPGDIILMRTGVGAMVHAHAATGELETAVRPYEGPGLASEPATLAWLWDHQVAAIASDNLAVEAWPPLSEEKFLHMQVIPLLGLVLGELFDLETLADDCAQDGRFEVFFTAKPLMLRGGVGSPANAMVLK